MIRAAGIALLAYAAPAAAQLSPRDLAAVAARPAAGARLPATLAFTDQNGGGTTLGAVAGGHPLVLLSVDHTCRHLCGPGLTLTSAALAATGLAPGRDYRLAVIGIDPRDGVAAARADARRITPAAAARAARLLVGSPGAIAAATGALGYRSVYDAAADQFAHDASVYVFAADGRLVATLPELGVGAPALRAALGGAAPPATLGDRIARLCYGLGEAHGRFGRPIALALQAFAALTLAAMGAFLLRRGRRA